MTGASPPRVFVVDDDTDMRTSLSRALRMRDFQVEAYASAPAFLESYDKVSAGCLILDYGMPEMSGLELQELVNRRNYPLAIIFITGHGGVPESVQAMKGGAVDFLEKPFRQSVLVDRIHAACAIASDMLEAAGLKRDLARRFERLTAREREIVDRILAHPAEVSSKEMGRLLGISPRTVDHHRARILEKLEIRSVAELIGMAKELTGPR